MNWIQKQADVVIIGAGAAGLRAAIEIGQGGGKALILRKTRGKRDSCSTIAAGWITHCPPECSREFFRQVVTVGGCINDQSLARTLAEDVVEAIPELERWGVRFIVPDGCAPHPPVPGLFKIQHSKGTPSGFGLTNPLTLAAEKLGVEFCDAGAAAILLESTRAAGVMGFTLQGQPLLIGAGAVILAAGGGAGLFGKTDNPPGNTGDGFSLAYRCGAELRDMEFISFHLAPAKLQLLLEAGEQHRAEILAASFAHYFLGGVVIDENGQTTVEGLYACGEVAGGVLGALRLGGSALADAIVFGRRVGKAVVRRNRSASAIDLVPLAQAAWQRLQQKCSPTGLSFDQAARRLTTALWQNAGPVKNMSSLSEAQGVIVSLRSQALQVSESDLFRVAQFHAALDVAEMIIRASLLRQESRGAFWRTDFPTADNARWLKNIHQRIDRQPVIKEIPLVHLQQPAPPIIAAGCYHYLD